VRDPNNTLTTLAYNPRLWLTSAVLTTSSGNLTTSLNYDSAGELTKTTLPDSSFLSYTYDNAHQLTKITNALSETANFTYNSAGNLTQTLWKTSGGTTKRQHTATFDALGRMLTDVGAVSQTTSFAYDSDSNVTSITDPLSHVTTRTFDALNRLKTTTNPVHDLVQIAYDSHSRFTSVTDGKGNATSFVYDGFGDMIQQVSPDSGKSVFWFDPDGNVTKQSAFAVTNATYDALDRMLTRTYPADSSLNVSLTYDQAGHGSGIGLLTSATDPAGSLSLSWDQRGLLTSNARTISGHAYTTGYTYESAGRLASITYASSGWLMSYGRDSAGQVNFVSAKQPGHSAVRVAGTVTHLPFGPVTGFTANNGVTDTRTYDLDYRMTSVKDTGTSGNIQYLSYGYNADNNPTSITDNVTGGNSQTLTYDALDRLKSAVGAYGTVSSITYDSNSNRKTYGAVNYTVPSTSNKVSAIGAASITYSSTGNITQVGTSASMTYDKANRLATATAGGTTTTYTYDAFGTELLYKIGTGAQQPLQYDQWDNLETEANSNTETDYAYLDPVATATTGNPIAVAVIQPFGATVSSLHTDAIGTMQRATSAAQAMAWTGTTAPTARSRPPPRSPSICASPATGSRPTASSMWGRGTASRRRCSRPSSSPIRSTSPEAGLEGAAE
jgi:YD repeat-containing protein